MGSQCSIAPSKRRVVCDQEVNPLISNETRGDPVYVATAAMGERSNPTDFNSFMQANNATIQIAKQWFDQLQPLRDLRQQLDTLSKENHELKSLNEQVKKDNQSLRKRYVRKRFLSCE